MATFRRVFLPLSASVFSVMGISFASSSSRLSSPVAEHRNDVLQYSNEATYTKSQVGVLQHCPCQYRRALLTDPKERCVICKLAEHISCLPRQRSKFFGFLKNPKSFPLRFQCSINVVSMINSRKSSYTERSWVGKNTTKMKGNNRNDKLRRHMRQRILWSQKFS